MLTAATVAALVQSLLLDDNMISDLPGAMNFLVNLRSLSVAHNALSSLPMKLSGYCLLVYWDSVCFSIVMVVYVCMYIYID